MICYGKNIQGIEEIIDLDAACTRTMPMGNNDLMLPEKYVDSPYIENYTDPIIKVVSFDDIGVDTDNNVNVDVAVVLLRTVVIKYYATLETVNLGNTVMIRHKRIGIDLSAQVIEMVTDPLTGRITNLIKECGQMINTIDHTINIDLANEINMNSPINIKQNDTNSHKFIINMFNSSASHDLTGLTVRIYFKKPDGTTVFLDCVLDGSISNKLSVLLTTQTLTVIGSIASEITIYGTSGEIQTSFTFNFNVLEKIRDDGAIESTNDFTALTTALAVVTTIANKADKTYVDSNLATINTRLTNIPLQPYITEKAKQVDLTTTNDKVSKNTTDITTKVEKSGVLDDVLLAPKSISKYIPSTNKTNVYELMFYLPDTGTMQGMTYWDGYFYVSYDLGNPNGKICKYDSVGNKISETSSMAIGHCAEIAYRASTGKIYVSNGGGTNPTHVYVVDYATSAILIDLDYTSLGNSALVAIDNVHDYMILHATLTGGDTGTPTFTIINLVNSDVIATFSIPTQGIPQGLESDGKNIYFYTDNKVTILDYEGTILSSYAVDKNGESEGLTLASEYGTTFIAMGYSTPNRIYALRSVENDKFHNLKLMNYGNADSTGTVPMLPRIFTMPIKKIDDTTYGIAPWANCISDCNMIESITCTTKTVTVVLKFAFTSIGYFGVSPSNGFAWKQLDLVVDVLADGKTINLTIFSLGVASDLSLIPVGNVFKILIVGGVSATEV